MKKDQITLEDYWERAGDGRLVYHAAASTEDSETGPLVQITIAFSTTARRHLDDAGCRRLAARLDCKKIHRALQILGLPAAP